MAIVDVDDSFKRPGTIPFSWEIRPGVPKTRIPQPGNTTTPFLHPPKKLSPLRLKPLSHSQPLYPPALSPPSSSFIANSKTRPLSPLTPFSTTPSKLKPPPTPSSPSVFYSPGPSFRSSPRAFSERWQPQRPNRIQPGSEPEPEQSSDFAIAGFGCFPSPKFRLRKNKGGGSSRRKNRSRSENEYYCSDMETMSPWTVSSRRSVSPRWDSPKSSFSSLRFSPRITNEAEWVGFGLF
ncbi:PREDICTED: leucine-rich repeat extensin-like protein 5 [Camelina sativa]|uniref:Leucine-rich repeat extensin-like protein 5 n=1 Tax=Camelina sativa TaxID=90675 RepID=A0ABM0WJD5_CAMSA|nr:PREDICTED: leucine-rich repeat extensin-like protein 5 [Camelina sativa]